MYFAPGTTSSMSVYSWVWISVDVQLSVRKTLFYDFFHQEKYIFYRVGIVSLPVRGRRSPISFEYLNRRKISFSTGRNRSRGSDLPNNLLWGTCWAFHLPFFNFEQTWNMKLEDPLMFWSQLKITLVSNDAGQIMWPHDSPPKICPN